MDIYLVLHPVHLNDQEMSTRLHESIQFELLRADKTTPINDGKIVIKEDFNGRLEIVAIFPGNMHYRSANRSVSLNVRKGDSQAREKILPA